MREVLVFASHGIGLSLSPFLFSFSLSYFSSTFSLSASRQKRKKMNVSISFYRTNKRQCLERHSLLLLSSPFSYGWVYQYKTPNFIWKHLYRKHPHSFYFSLVCSNQLQIYSFDVVFPNIHSYVVTSTICIIGFGECIIEIYTLLYLQLITCLLLFKAVWWWNCKPQYYSLWLSYERKHSLAWPS